MSVPGGGETGGGFPARERFGGVCEEFSAGEGWGGGEGGGAGVGGVGGDCGGGVGVVGEGLRVV